MHDLHSNIVTALVLSLFLMSVPQPATADTLQAADLAWAQRAAGFATTGRISPEPISEALRDYEQALQQSPEDLGLRFKVLEALYFKGHFVVEDRREKKRIFGEMTDLAEETVDLAVAAGIQERTRAHFWAAISWGLWGMSHSRFAAGTAGVAGKIRDHAEAVIELDEEFANAGGLRLLGRLHTATPKVPLFTGWIDRHEGLTLLERAYAISNRDPRNALFLAEALLECEPDQKERALKLLHEVGARSLDPTYLVEESETLDAARRLLASMEGS